MGWNNWNATHCGPSFNEQLVLEVADLLLDKGLADLGYTSVNLDDCWALPQRDAGGNLVPDPVRFPRGIKPLADDIHARGLRFGIYTSAGTKTCSQQGFPGGLDHEEADARLFASFGVDYLKYDNCNNQGRDAVERYTAMRDALLRADRPIVYGICEWGQNEPWTWAGELGQLWRTTGDISDNWDSLRSIIGQNMGLGEYAGPHGWNDPDMLEIGNGGMSDVEYRTHMSLWAIMAAPLLIGADLRAVDPATLEILGNREVVAIDQDPLGVQGRPVSSGDGHHVLVKPLDGGDRAVALFNETDAAATIAAGSEELDLAGLDRAPTGRYRVRDVWGSSSWTVDVPGGGIEMAVPAHGTALLRVGPVT